MAAGALLLGALLFSGCTTTVRTGVVKQVPPTSPVVLGPGDVVRVSFTTAPELNGAQKIRSDGRISLPQVGEIRAGGKTLGQLQAELRSLYSSQLKNTDVVVTLDSGTAEVYLSGAVKSPGKKSFDRPTTVLQAIMDAGGPNQFGNLRKVHLIRISNGVERTQVLDLKPTIQGVTTRAFYVRNGDIISVPESLF